METRTRCHLRQPCSGDHDRIARGSACAIAESGRAIERERQAVAGIELMAGLANAHLDRAGEHPHLLMHLALARAGRKGHPGSGRELDLDDLDRRGKLLTLPI